MSIQFSTPPSPGRSSSVHRLTRLIRIMTTLQREPLTRYELSERFCVSERRITQDIAVLRAAGVRVEHDAAGYWIDEELAITP